MRKSGNTPGSLQLKSRRQHRSSALWIHPHLDQLGCVVVLLLDGRALARLELRDLLAHDLTMKKEKGRYLAWGYKWFQGVTGLCLEIIKLSNRSLWAQHMFPEV